LTAVVLVGGASRMPAVQRALRRLTGLQPRWVTRSQVCPCSCSNCIPGGWVVGWVGGWVLVHASPCNPLVFRRPPPAACLPPEPPAFD
jgi:hypothetical protein